MHRQRAWRSPHLERRVHGDPASDGHGGGGAQPPGPRLRFLGLDGYPVPLPVALAETDETLVVHAMNGEALNVDHGAPARLLVPGRYGMFSVKWLDSITATRAYHEWGALRSLNSQIDGRSRVRSRIDGPSDGAMARVGEAVTITGLALTPGTGVARVQVETEAGWQDAELTFNRLEDGRSRYLWSLYRFAWTPRTPGVHVLGCAPSTWTSKRSLRRLGFPMIAAPFTLCALLSAPSPTLGAAALPPGKAALYVSGGFNVLVPTVSLGGTVGVRDGFDLDLRYDTHAGLVHDLSLTGRLQLGERWALGLGLAHSFFAFEELSGVVAVRAPFSNGTTFSPDARWSFWRGAQTQVFVVGGISVRWLGLEEDAFGAVERRVELSLRHAFVEVGAEWLEEGASNWLRVRAVVPIEAEFRSLGYLPWIMLGRSWRLP